MLKFAGYSFPEALARSDAQDIAETLERIMINGFDPEVGGVSRGDYYYYSYDDDSCIEMN